jgi:TusA-related sulfurtransferase
VPDPELHFLDIRDDVCPMTFVKARLLVEKMSPGDSAEILLRGDEPTRNVPASIAELGHSVLEMSPFAGDGTTDGDMRLVVRKN